MSKQQNQPYFRNNGMTPAQADAALKLCRQSSDAVVRTVIDVDPETHKATSFVLTKPSPAWNGEEGGLRMAIREQHQRCTILPKQK